MSATQLSLLSNKAKNLLSRLDDCLEKSNISVPSEWSVQNVENTTYKCQITWICKNSDIYKSMAGKCFKSSCAQVNFQGVGKIWLEMNCTSYDLSNSMSVDLFLCFNNIPQNMYILCNVFSLEDYKLGIHHGQLPLRDRQFYGKACNIKERKIPFKDFVLPENFENQHIFCRLKLVSNIYKCELKNTKVMKYVVNETPRFDKYMEDILVKGKYSDVVLKVEDSNIKSHKCILALKSPSLRILLKLESEPVLRNDKYTTIKHLINFMYTEDIQILNFHHACKLYESAYKYEILSLKTLCSAYLNVSLTEKNISFLFDLSRTMNDEHLQAACIKFIKDNRIEVTRKAFLSSDEMLL